MKIAVYGGSFNPPHLGHVAALKTAVRELSPDRTLVIPDYAAPHKEMPEGTPSPQERLEMCRIAFSGIPGAEISDMELNRGGKSYTSDTVAELKVKHPGCELFLIIGSDMLLSFTTWHEFEYILGNCVLAVLSREENDIAELEASAVELREKYGADVRILPHLPLVLSSTEVRAALAAGSGSGFLPAGIPEYIKDHKLYGMSSITDNVKRILEEIGPDINLVAATKMNDADRVKEAIRAGVKICGENRVQEMLEKNALGAYEGAELHFIGHLQKNKVNKVVGLCSLIQSVDSFELLEAIGKQAVKLGIIQDVLLEINIGGEESKSGFSPEEITGVLDAASKVEGVRILGLMTIPPVCGNEAESGPFFAQMRNIFVDIGTKKYDNISMDFLSMGMSSDYAEAVRNGSNMVRIGSGIFGPRHYSCSEA